MAAFWVVDHHTHCLLCLGFSALHLQKASGYCMEPKLTAEEVSNLHYL